MRLLLVEDEKELARALVTVLTYNHYSVDEVYDGEQAVVYLENGNYDGVILDIMLPKLDGISVLKKIRAQGNQVPVLILSARSALEDKVNGLDCGADDYLTKPFATKELLARVRAMTRRRENVMEPNLHFEDLELSATSFQLGCNGEWVYLANKEYQMMEMLLKNPRCVLSAEQFIEAIWGYESNVENNVVWTYISRLRRILKQLDSHTVIRTAKGIGFALEKDDD